MKRSRESRNLCEKVKEREGENQLSSELEGIKGNKLSMIEDGRSERNEVFVSVINEHSTSKLNRLQSVVNRRQDGWKSVEGRRWRRRRNCKVFWSNECVNEQKKRVRG